MKRLLAWAAVATVAVTVGVSSGRAAPIPGGTHVSGTWSYTDYLFFGGLSGLGCPFVLHDYGDNAIGTLSATYNGWQGPIDQTTFDYQVLLRAHVTGTVQDAAGNTYTVNGNFTDRSTRNLFGDFDLEFKDGPGHVTISGPAGTVVGRANFRFVEGPPEMSLTFTSIQNCTV